MSLVPSRTYRFTPPITSIRTPNGAFAAYSSNRFANRRSSRGPPSIAAASTSVTAPCAARCSNSLADAALGEVSTASRGSSPPS